MNGLFGKENRLVGTLDERGKRERLLYLICGAALFAINGFFLFEFMYELCNILGSVVSGTPVQALVVLGRMLPLIILFASASHAGLYVHSLYRATSEEKRVRGWLVNGIITASFGFIIMLIVMIGIIAGNYGAIIEGNPTPLYPLDVLLCGLVVFIAGFLAMYYSLYLKSNPSRLPYEPSKLNTVTRGFSHFYYGLAYLLASFALAAVIYGLFTMDWTHGYIFFNVMLLLTYLCSPGSLIFYEMIILEATDEAKAKIKDKYSIILFTVNIVIFALYLAAVQLENEAPNLNAFSILPVEFTASFNAFPVLYAIPNVLGPFILMLRGGGMKPDEKPAVSE